MVNMETAKLAYSTKDHSIIIISDTPDTSPFDKSYPNIIINMMINFVLPISPKIFEGKSVRYTFIFP